MISTGRVKTDLDIFKNHFLGFHEDFFNGFRSITTYPPYNIKEKDDKGVIEFAVAGFTEDDLKVEVKENTLNISGCKEKELEEDLMHKGISDRSFIKKFQLHKQIVVDKAELKNGLLKVSYHREIPEAEKPKQIKIKST
jgi:molecular chaperone IbpA